MSWVGRSWRHKVYKVCEQKGDLQERALDNILKKTLELIAVFRALHLGYSSWWQLLQRARSIAQPSWQKTRQKWSSVTGSILVAKGLLLSFLFLQNLYGKREEPNSTWLCLVLGKKMSLPLQTWEGLPQRAVLHKSCFFSYRSDLGFERSNQIFGRGWANLRLMVPLHRFTQCL